MSDPRTVLLDSDAFIGLFVEQDVHHRRVGHALRAIDAAGQIPTATNFVIVETATTLSRRHHQEIARQFLQYLRQSEFAVIYIISPIQQKAEDLFLEQHNQNTSLVDCTNVVIAQSYGITQILSFDQFYRRFPLEMIG